MALARKVDRLLPRREKKMDVDIERLMTELRAARDYLQAEGERVRQINANYAHLAQTASASARIIVESIGAWGIPELTNIGEVAC
jgi:hypothetical protein